MKSTGKIEICILLGKSFKLILKGEQQTQKLQIGSEYYERLVNGFCFTGTGVLESLEGNICAVFTFKTWDEESYSDRSLEEFVLRFQVWSSREGRHLKEPSFEEAYKPLAVDALCQHIEKTLLKSDEPIPHYRFDSLSSL